MAGRKDFEKDAPWVRRNPKPTSEKKRLSPNETAAAKASARKAGRPYPNLVDNMRVAAKKKKK